VFVRCISLDGTADAAWMARQMLTVMFLMFPDVLHSFVSVADPS